MEWLKRYEYVATWIGMVVTLAALVPFKKVRWGSMRVLMFSAVFICFCMLAIVMVFTSEDIGDKLLYVAWAGMCAFVLKMVWFGPGVRIPKGAGKPPQSQPPSET